MDFNPMKFADIAKFAASELVEKNVALDETIAKIAEKNNFSPIQIQRVVEMANLEANDRFFKLAGDKTFTFPLASLPGVQGVMHKEGAAPTTASAVLDMLCPAPKAEAKQATLSKIAGVTPRDPVLMEKRASQAVDTVMDEVKRRVGELALKKVANDMAVDRSYATLRERVREYVMLDHGHIQDMVKFACATFPDSKQLWVDVFTGIKEDLMKLGQPVDTALINQNIEMPGGTLEIINGAHSFQIDLDQFRRKVSDGDSVAGAIRLINDAPNAPAVDFKTLRDSQDVALYLASEVENLAKKASVVSDEVLFKAAALFRKIAADQAITKRAKFLSRFISNHPYLTIMGALGGPLVANAALKGVGRAAGRAYTMEGRKPWSPEEEVEGHGYRHTGYAR